MSQTSLSVQPKRPLPRRSLVDPVVVEAPSPVDLAETANREHELVRSSSESMIGHAMAAGQALIAAKAQLEHGEWLPWLAANFLGSEKAAQNYMRIAANPHALADLDDPSITKALTAIAGGEMAHVGNNSGENEWYTPEPYITAARVVMGGIDLDPASSAEANAVVKAETYCTPENDGLDQPWSGRVWMNPPYAQPLIWKFCEKLADEVAHENVEQAIVLVNNGTETAWFQRLCEVAAAICFPSGRIKFWHPERDSATPLQGQAVLYFGQNVEAFRAEFLQFGVTVVL